MNAPLPATPPPPVSATLTPQTTNLVVVSVVQAAFAARAAGDHSKLTELLAELTAAADRRDADGDRRLCVWLSALSQSVSSISRSDLRLVDLLLTLPWLSRDDAVAATFLHLVENLVSAQPGFAVPVVKGMVRAIQFRRPYGSDYIPHDVYYNRLHAAMRSVLSITPTGPSFIMPLLAEQFPHRMRPLIDQQAFVQNLLRMLSYAPVLREPVLELILDRILQIDIELQVDVDDLEANPTDAQFLFEMDGISADGLPDMAYARTDNGAAASAATADAVVSGLQSDSDDDSDVESDDGNNAPPRGASAEALMAKLDHMLYIVFMYLSSPAAVQHCTPTELFATVIRLFDRHILPTYKSRHTQFVVFYLAAQDPQFTDLFLGLLGNKIVSIAEPAIVRMSAALYMASFVARANYLPHPHVVGCFQLLVQWARAFVEANEQYVVYPDVDKFGVFYAVVQAIMYMYCFRWRELAQALGSKGGLDGFQMVILSRFNPLKVLAPAVVTEFARVTHELNVLYCYAVIQRNKRLYIPTRANGGVAAGTADAATTSSGPANLSTNTLDSFFPFDPCKLPLTSPFILPMYTDWTGGPTPDTNDGMVEDVIALADPNAPPSRPPSGAGTFRESSPVPFAHHGGSAVGIEDAGGVTRRRRRGSGNSNHSSHSGSAAAPSPTLTVVMPVQPPSPPSMVRAKSSAGITRRRNAGTGSMSASGVARGGPSHSASSPLLASSTLPSNGRGHQPHQAPTSASAMAIPSSRAGSQSPLRSAAMAIAGNGSPMSVTGSSAAAMAAAAAAASVFDNDDAAMMQGLQAMSISPMAGQGASVLMSQLGMGRA
ncbi:RNA polymerase I-specific transcription initiation factor RRN3-domain-containing protein [Blastocladiella britannica]|nr:RNA polymerase I-specific transcription initiation factor RRN3-domain-containing protein [Blastocladiella britannica]